MASTVKAIAVGIVAVALGLYYSRSQIFSTQDQETERFSCLPFLPKLFVETPASISDPAIAQATKDVEQFFSNRFAQGDIDSLSVAVVTSTGPILERNYGVVRANESESPLTTSHSSYRIASVAKLFTALEGLILEQKGVLSWDDPVEKFFPGFGYRLDGFDPAYKSEPSSLTLFQLASHMSGLGRDWPPGTVKDWPRDLKGGGPPPTNGHPFASHEALFEAIRNIKLVSPPWSYPAYSNAGTGLLGLALVAANRAASKSPDKEPKTYAELLHRDIFHPLGLNGSHFLATRDNKEHIVVPSVAPEVATLLNPAHPKSLIKKHTLDKWLRPVHDFEEDDWTQMGFTWEIVKAKDSNGRARKIYWKLGAMAGYHSAMAFHPGTNYGIVVLMAARYPDAAKLAYDAFEMMQPGVDRALSDMAAALYAGTWSSQDGESAAVVSVRKGTLYAESFVLNGTDALATLHVSGRVPLRSSGRRDEFRLDTGLGFYNGQRHMGCYPYWNGQDIWGMRNDAPVNLLYFTGGESDRALHAPSVDVVMFRA
ncbi:beta-lactamase/transpeptidase-like protein [Heliocybe sulcata]|uniref:Beta-lactamase/transpeptidase-like protein n=1 Tax=Heliocybe sulcata TaxID=5364 RepID=A0A5C3MVL3_9AGAM|nr:beta-lactamase/transpeptidase-like protein [Heliocybe sulcata]